jgi:hypothetical protein
MIARAFLFVFLVVEPFVAVFCQPAVAPAPGDWTRHSACRVEFSLPTALKRLEKKGIDSCVARFEGGGIFVLLDVGLYGSPARQTGIEQEFKESDVNLDGQRGRLATYLLPGPAEEERIRVARLYVPLKQEHLGSEGPAMTKSVRMDVTGSGENLFVTARTIFDTIRFKSSERGTGNGRRE